MAAALTWAWQGSLVALILGAVLRAAPALRLTAATRYRICWLALGVVLALPLVPALVAAVPAAGGHATMRGGALTLPGPPPALAAAAAAVWMLAAAAGAMRLALDLLRLRRMKARARPVSEARQRRLPLWQSVRHRGRRARLVVVDERVPTAVLGFGRPLIVVPRTLLEALGDAELDQVLAHEHAHVERRDDWANLLQRVIAVPFGLHPAVWLIGRWMRRERELAADERVAVRTGAPRAYARCLARVAEVMTWPAAPRLAPGAFGCRGEVERRVVHLLDSRRHRARRASRRVLVPAAALAVAAGLALGRGPAVELGTEGAAATRARVGPPPSPAPPLPAAAAPGNASGPTAARPRPGRVAGIRLPARRTLAPLTATALFVRDAPPPLLPAASSRGGGLRGWSRTPLPARDLGLSARRTLVTSVEGNVEARQSPWAWTGRAGASLGSWFAGAGNATAGAFRGFGASLARAFSGR